MSTVTTRTVTPRRRSHRRRCGCLGIAELTLRSVSGEAPARTPWRRAAAAGQPPRCTVTEMTPTNERLASLTAAQASGERSATFWALVPQ
jgi:hypothetical protein